MLYCWSDERCQRLSLEEIAGLADQLVMIGRLCRS
jgi:hypothetical protein